MSQASEGIAKQFSSAIMTNKVWGGIVVNVKAFGAEGDGETDDTKAIQAAIDYAVSIGMNEVTFPAGTYKYGVINSSGVTFVGDGVTLNGTTPKTVISISDLASVAINVKSFGAVGDGVSDDTPAIQKAFDALVAGGGGAVLLPSGIYKTSGFTIPQNNTLVTTGPVTINTTGTILVGYGSTIDGEDLTINASTVSTPDFSIVKVSKYSNVTLKEIIGYKVNGASKGDTTTAKGIDATDSDFLYIRVLKAIRQCKYAFYLSAGAVGSGGTINGSIFVSKYIADCYYGYYQAGAGMNNITTESYIEYCNVAVSLRESFYGHHMYVFDQVDSWIENRNTSWFSRLGDVFLPSNTMAELSAKTDRYIAYTRFHCKDGLQLNKTFTNAEANLMSQPDSKIFMKSGKAELRLVSDTSKTLEPVVSASDTSDGITASLGNSASKFVVELQTTRSSLLSVPFSGDITTRNGMVVGDPAQGVKNIQTSNGDFESLTIGKGFVVKSPNGTRYRLTVDNAGALVITAI